MLIAAHRTARSERLIDREGNARIRGGKAEWPRYPTIPERRHDLWYFSGGEGAMTNVATRARRATPLLATTALALSACNSTATGGAGSSGSGSMPSSASSGSSGGSASSGSGSGNATGGEDAGTSTGGTSAGGSGGSSGSSAGSADGGDDGGGSADSGSGGSTEGGLTGPFACNLIVGNSTTQQFFDNGFLTYPGIDPTKWELFWVVDHYIDLWANPMDPAWSTAFDNGHRCAADSTMPDRVIFIATRWPPEPESYYQTNMTSIVEIIRTKYAAVQRIELMTLARALDNKGCDGTQSEQTIPPAEDQGLAATAEAFPGLVFVVPPQYVLTCADFESATAPQYSATPGAADMAKVYGMYYAANP